LVVECFWVALKTYQSQEDSFTFSELLHENQPVISFWMGTNYASDIVPLSNWIDREDETFKTGWTIFYWAWWVSWSPFFGMFIARISKATGWNNLRTGNHGGIGILHYLFGFWIPDNRFYYRRR